MNTINEAINESDLSPVQKLIAKGTACIIMAGFTYLLGNAAVTIGYDTLAHKNHNVAPLRANKKVCDVKLNDGIRIVYFQGGTGVKGFIESMVELAPSLEIYRGNTHEIITDADNHGIIGDCYNDRYIVINDSTKTKVEYAPQHFIKESKGNFWSKKYYCDKDEKISERCVSELELATQKYNRYIEIR